MIKHLSSRAHTDEVIGTSTMINEAVNKSAYKNEGLSNLNKKLTAKNNELTIAQNRKKKNDETKKVANAKRLRARAFSSFAYSARGVSLRALKDLSAGGQLIYEVVKRHWTGFKNLPQSEQTAKVLSFVEEIERPAYSAALQSGNLLDNLEELKKSNSFFIGTVANRTKIEVANKELENVAEARKNTKHIFDQMINYLNGLSEAEESAELAELCSTISRIIDKANSVVQSRLTRNGSNGDFEEENDENLDEKTEEDS